MKNNGWKKNERRWTALLTMLLCAVLCVTAVTGCGAKPAEPADSKPVNAQTEPTEPDAGQAFAVKVTDLGGDTFRLEDTGYTPGLNMTVMVPESWAGRYTCRIHDTGVTFYCKAVQDETEELPGLLCSFYAKPGTQPLNCDMDGIHVIATSREYATGLAYSVIMGRPTDVQCTESTEEEWQSMSRDIDTRAVTLAPEMERNTWNETNWVAGTVSLRTFDQDGEHTVICDAETSATIRQMLESRTYAEHEDWWRDLGGARAEIIIDDVLYSLCPPQGSDPQICHVYRNDGRFAAEPLTMEELEQIQMMAEQAAPGSGR